VYSFNCDLWGLAQTFYWMASNKLPFGRMADFWAWNAIKWTCMWKMKTAHKPPPASLGPEFSELMSAMLTHYVSKRPQISEIVKMLEKMAVVDDNEKNNQPKALEIE
jgi:serine/threonine protein kinase